MPSPQRTTTHQIVRYVSLGLAGLVVLLLLGAGAGALYLSRADLKPLVEREASDALGRRVSFGSFQVRWGDPLRVDFTDLAIANAPWGSKPQMVRVGKLSAQLEVGPLLHGVLHYRQLRLSDVTVVLERDPHGIGNWKFAGGGIGLVPKNRTQFATLIDFAGERGLITYRTRSGNVLGIRLDRVAIASPTEQTPVQLVADGAYNDVPTRLEATTDSFAVMRDAAVPFGARFTLAGPDTDIAFSGTLREPLDFEGARGELTIDARSLDDLIAAMGGKARADLPMTVAGVLVRNGDHWSLDAAKGRLQQSDFSGALALIEGKPRQLDDVALDLGFSDLDVDALVASFGNAKDTIKLGALPLHPEGLSEVNATVALTAESLAITKRKLRTVTLDGRLAGGDVTLKELSFALGGGRLSASGALQGKDDSGRLTLRARLAKAEIAQLARQLGANGDEIRGRLDAAASLAMTGPSVGAALQHSAGAAVLLMRDGQVARSLIEQLSTDLRSLFRERQEQVPVTCLLGIVTVKDGVGVISPLRLESDAAVAVGAGKIDLVRDRLDLTMRTERDSTSFFALDIPVRISGPLDSLSAAALTGDETALRQPATAARTLPPDLRQMADGNACAD
ncbi:MAG TPA: AsmA family protein [Dongiaceae bacterium]|nr:AsmA family protein [Dongiaceae bacterium]